MVDDTIAVTNGDTTEQCDVIETYSHYGTDVAEVEGTELSGFVEL